MGEVIQRLETNGGLLEVLRLPSGALAYRSSATGYSLYSNTMERAMTVLGHLQGKT